MRLVGVSAEFDVYVSDAGRPFSRLRISRSGSKGGSQKTGSKDAVGGQGSPRNVSFSGNTMTVSMPRGTGGALGITVTFDNAFQSCSARTVSGKASGVAASRATSIISGRTIDVYSIKTSGEACRVQNGNMFAN
jgi:hypothetical protein